MAKLERFHLGFRSPRPPPGPASRHPHTTLPALNRFHFQGDSEYLDDLAAHIDTRLQSTQQTFCNIFPSSRIRLDPGATVHQPHGEAHRPQPCGGAISRR